MAVNGGSSVDQCMIVVDELENLARSAKRSWIRSDAVTINQKDLTDNLALLRASLPDAVVNADRIVHDEAEILNKAKQEAEASIAGAKQEAAKIVEDAKVQLGELERQIRQLQQETQRIQAENEQRLADGVKKAQDEASTIVAQAHEEAARLVNLGEQRAMELVTEEAVYQRAEMHANELVESATAEAEQLRQKTFSYLDSVLAKIEGCAGDVMADIHDRRDMLNGYKH